jgi:hypothetical protein
MLLAINRADGAMFDSIICQPLAAGLWTGLQFDPGW